MLTRKVVMKILSSIVLGFLFCLSVAECISAEDSSSLSGIRIRIANISNVPFSEVSVRFPSQEEKYGALAPGASSEYRDVEVAYRYASATVMADGQMFRAMAIDYMGEKRLEAGLYTYTLDISGGSLSFGFLIDDE